MENKKEITAKLGELLKLTRGGYDIESLEYVKEDNGDEFVFMKFDNGYSKRICVTADSGIAMIVDITRKLF